jgi:hypothetical protein
MWQFHGVDLMIGYVSRYGLQYNTSNKKLCHFIHKCGQQSKKMLTPKNKSLQRVVRYVREKVKHKILKFQHSRKKTEPHNTLTNVSTESKESHRQK